MTREDKLARLREAKASKDMVIISNGEPFIEVLSDKIKELKTTLGAGIELNNLDDLLEQLGLVQSFQQEVKSLKESISAINLPDSVSIDGLDELVKVAKTLSNKKDPEFKQLDEELFTDITKSIVELTHRVEEAAVQPKQGQLPQDYIPMRRVLKVGNKLLYDDSFYTGGGGGGGSSSSGGSSTIAGTALPIAGATSALGVAIVDSAGNQISSFGGGIQYVEDAVSAANPTGTTPNLIRQDTPTDEVSNNGDNIAHRGTKYGAAYTQIVSSSGSFVDTFGGGTQYADGAVRGTGTGTLLMVDDGTNIQSAIGTSAGVLKVDVSATAANGTAIKVDASSVAVPITDNSGSLTVDNAGTFAVQATLAAGATSIGKAEDVASADADVGIPAMAIRKATPANTSGTDGDYEMLQVSAGRLWASAIIDTALPAGTNLLGKVGIDQTTPGSTNLIALTAETTKVIGVTRTADGSGNLLTSTSNALDINLKTSSITLPVSIAGTVTIAGAVTETTLDAALISQEATTSGVKGLTVFGAVTTAAPTYTTAKSDALSLTTGGALRGDITTIAGTAPTTVGKLDVKGADGDVFVRQATGTNLHTVIDSGTITTLTGTTTLTPGTGASNLGKAEDQASADGDVGVGAIVIQKATPADTAGTDGDYSFMQMSGGRLWTSAQGNKTNNNAAPGATNLGTLSAVANAAAPSFTEGNQVTLSTDLAGALRVTGSLSVGGTTDQATFIAASSTITTVAGAYNDSLTALTSGTQAAVRLTAYRGEHVNLRDSSGNELGIPTRPLLVDIQDQLNTVNTGSIGGNEIAVVAPGVQLVAQAGPTGDPLDTTNNALNVSAAQNGNWNVSNNVEVGTLFNYVESTVAVAIKTSAGYLLSFIVTNYNSTKRYFQVFDQKTAPAPGNIPVLSIPIPAGTTDTPGYLELGPSFFGSGGLSTLQGIAIGISTAGANFGAATASQHTITGFYI